MVQMLVCSLLFTLGGCLIMWPTLWESLLQPHTQSSPALAQYEQRHLDMPRRCYNKTTSLPKNLDISKSYDPVAPVPITYIPRNSLDEFHILNRDPFFPDAQKIPGFQSQKCSKTYERPIRMHKK